MMNAFGSAFAVESAYYMLVSGFAFLVMGRDKLAARSGRQRIAESTLLMLGFAGGWPGTWLAGQVFRHKVSKRTFQVRLAIVTLLNVSILGVISIFIFQFGGPA